MAGSSILVINAAGAETRVALVESGTIHEFYLERKREKGIVGNIYKGRVVRVLPGMQAAFVDIGLEKAAFLYVGDVYGDPDFSEEFELTEGEHGNVLHEVPTEQEAEEQEARARAEASRGDAPPPDAGQHAPASEPPPADLTATPGLEGPPQDAGEHAMAASGDLETAAPSEPQPPPGGAEQALLTPIPLTHAVGMEPVPAVPPLLVPEASPADAPVEAPPAAALTPPALADATASPAQTELELRSASPSPVEAAPVTGQLQARPAEAPREAREGRERGRRDGKEGREERSRGRGEQGRAPNGARHNGHGREERREKSGKSIQDLLKEGQEVIVQVAKDPIGTKGARITSHISLPGRHMVFMPTVDHIGISRRIEKEGERRRLREIVDRMRPEGTGFIVRTVAENVEAPKLEADIRFLIQVWNEIIRTKDKVGAPALLHPDLDLILRATRDLFSSDVQKLVIDDRDEYGRIQNFLKEQAPHLASQIEFYQGEEPIFDAYGIEQELKRASQRKVWLKSGGYIIMDQAEALTAIDVNSGRYVGKKNLEETITKINTEAAKEIVYQLR